MEINLPIILIYLAGGACAGLLAGLLGIGGGILIVPMLSFILPWQGVPPALVMPMAIGTSLAIIVITSCSSTLAHYRRGGINWQLVKRLVPGIFIGSLVGIVIAHFVTAPVLRITFAVFMLLIAIKMGFNLQFFRAKKQEDKGENPSSSGSHHQQKYRGLLAAGGIVSALAVTLGIGGGVLLTPYLRSRQVAMIGAVATSSACTLAISLMGSMSYLFTGLHVENLPQWSGGYIYLPAFLSVACASFLFAPLGVKLAYFIPGEILQRCFAIFLACVSVVILI